MAYFGHLWIKYPQERFENVYGGRVYTILSYKRSKILTNPFQSYLVARKYCGVWRDLIFDQNLAKIGQVEFWLKAQLWPN